MNDEEKAEVEEEVSAAERALARSYDELERAERFVQQARRRFEEVKIQASLKKWAGGKQ